MTFQFSVSSDTGKSISHAATSTTSALTVAEVEIRQSMTDEIADLRVEVARLRKRLQETGVDRI